MPLHDKAFWGIVFFLVGIFLLSFISVWQNSFLISILIAVFIAVIFLVFKRIWFAVLSLLVILGSGYFLIFDGFQKDLNIPFGVKGEFEAVVIDASVGLEAQELVLELQEPFKGNIKVFIDRYPDFNYGDLVNIKSVIKKPNEKSEKYYEKESIFGISSFPEVKLIEAGKGSYVKAMLLKIKSFAENSFNKVLPKEKAAFMSGLTLGETAEFDKRFKEEMSITGTTHLVALSGYNITIIAKAIVLSLGLWFSRRKTFWISVLAIFGFVVMTGADPSVVRAAIMALLILLADRLERAYSFRNSIAIAAFIMVLFNPKILVFDIGFQLSFAAVMGLMYLKPAIEKIFNIKREPGFFGWRENLTTTTTAQAAVLPILLTNFGLFSPISLLTNVLVLTFIPITMFFGFLIIFMAVFSEILSSIFGWIANLFLSYEIGVINLFSKVDVQISVKSFSVILSIVYYAVLIWMIVYANKKKDYDITRI